MSNKKFIGSIKFDCSFCGTEWIESERSKYKIRTLKTISGKYWRQYAAICPNCKRETTFTEQLDK